MPYSDPNVRREKNKLYRQNNRDWFRAYRRKWWATRSEATRKAIHRRRRYKLTPEQFDALISRQRGNCAICAQPLDPRGGRRVHVDHCHDTGIVRGVLCVRCNLGLGKFNDSIEQLQRAIDYLSQTFKGH